jgi:hypothetical protein
MEYSMTEQERDEIIEGLTEWCEQGRLYLRCIYPLHIYYNKEFEVLSVVDENGAGIWLYIQESLGNEMAIEFRSENFEIVVKKLENV